MKGHTMSVTLRGKRWVVSLGSGSERIRQTFATQEEAKKYEVQVSMQRLGAMQSDSDPKAVTMGKLYNLAVQTRWKYLKSSKMLAMNGELVRDYFGENFLVANITTSMVREMGTEFGEKRGNGGSTLNKKLSALSVMLDIAEDEGFITSKPKLKRYPESTHRVRFMTLEEEAKAHQYCERMGFTDLSDFIVLAIDTGFRRGELLQLLYADCSGDVVVSHADETKGERARAVPLTARAKAVIARRKQGGQPKVFQGLSPRILTARLKALAVHMGLSEDKQFVLHMLRHTCASRLAQSGTNAPLIQKWLGHSSLATTQRYMHLTPDSLLEGVKALEAFDTKKDVTVTGNAIVTGVLPSCHSTSVSH